MSPKTLYSYLSLWLLLLSSVALCVPKFDSFTWINTHRHLAGDLIFTIITQAGDGLFIIMLSFILLFFNQRKMGIAMFATYILSGLSCSILKRVFNAPRPAYFLESDPDFHTVSWLPTAYYNSFPSGHTTSVFAAATIFALFSKNRPIARIALIIACLTAYSRVYLGQHFVEDIWFGSILGCTVSLVYYRLHTWWRERSRPWIRIEIPSLHI